tara:strand:- start:7975 stop:8280 length:306 start_codon:yes stop_codon:yes gene_type:complete
LAAASENRAAVGNVDVEVTKELGNATAEEGCAIGIASGVRDDSRLTAACSFPCSTLVTKTVCEPVESFDRSATCVPIEVAGTGEDDVRGLSGLPRNVVKGV